MATAKHRFTSAKADGGDTSLVRPSNWNAAHDGVYTVTNVKDSAYGAVGDGTTDDTAAIQAAITAVGTNGGTIYFPVGRYKITSTLTLSRNQKLIGEGSGTSYGGSLTAGPGATLVLSTDNIATMQIVNAVSVEHSGIVIENLNFHGNTPTTRTGIGVSIQNMNNWTIRNCSFREFNYGVDVDGTLDAAWAVVEQCILKNNLYGIRGANGLPIRVMGCNIQSVDQAGTYGIYNGRASQMRLIGVKFDGGDVQVYARGAATTIVGTHFEGALTASVELDGQVSGEDGKSHHIVGCHFNATSSASCVKIDAGVRRPPILFGNTWTSGVANNILDNSTTGYYRYDDRGQFRMVKGVITSNTTIDHDDSDFVRVDCSTGNKTITLPTIAGNKASLKGMMRTVMKIDGTTNTVTVDGAGTETINGALTQVLNSQWETITFVCDGTNWVIVGNVHHEDQAILDHTSFPGGTANFLREDGTWASPGGASGSPGFNTAMGYQYVRASGGSDANDGASPSTAKATIQAAHTALPSTGGTILLSEGTHNITSSVAITKRGVRLIGAGRTATRLKCGTNGIHMIHWSGADGYAANFLVTDGTGGDFGGSTAYALSGIWMDDAQETMLHNIRFDNIGKDRSPGLSWDAGPAGLRIGVAGIAGAVGGFGDWCKYVGLTFRDCYRSIAITSGANGWFWGGESYGVVEEHIYALKRAGAPGGNGMGHRFMHLQMVGTGQTNGYQVRIVQDGSLGHGSGADVADFAFNNCVVEFSVAGPGFGHAYVEMQKVVWWNCKFTMTTATGPTVRLATANATGNTVGPYILDGTAIFQVPVGSNLGLQLWQPSDFTGTPTTY